MPGKKTNESKSENKNVNKDHEKKWARKSNSSEVKLKVQKQFNRGEQSIDIQKAMGLSDSTVRTICDRADTIHNSTKLTTNLSVTSVTKSWCDATDKVERMLATWIEQQNQQNMYLSGAVIQEKVRHLHEDLTKDGKAEMVSYCKLGVTQPLQVSPCIPQSQDTFGAFYCCLSVCLSQFSQKLGNRQDMGNKLLQEWKPRSWLKYTVATM
jgi:hypothetical protein